MEGAAQVAERVGFEPTKSFDSALFKSAAINRSATSPAVRIPADIDATVRSDPGRDPAQGAGDGAGLSRPLRSKIEACPDGTSTTWILSLSFWMY